jgi:hypothetical protein
MRFAFTIRAVYNFCSRNDFYGKPSLIKILNVIFNNPVLGKSACKIVKKATYNYWIFV